MKRFFSGWIAVYIINSITGYIEHDIFLHKTYMQLMPALHSGDVKSKIWAFIITSLTSSFFFTLIYGQWQKKGNPEEGLRYGFFMGIWIFLGMALNTYAGTGLIPLSLALQWLIYGVIQYSIAGMVIAYVYNYKKTPVELEKIKG